MTEDYPRLLSNREIEEIFEDVRTTTLQGPSKEQPRLLLFGGPQGSRKTTLLPVVAEALGFQDAVKVDGDDLFTFHPRFDELAREYGASGGFRRCGKDVTVLSDMVLDHVRSPEQRQDLVLVGPYTNQDYTLQRINEFRDAGYEVEMAHTALHTARSQLGVMHRYHQAVAPGGPGYAILPSVELQETVYSGVPKIMTEAHRRGVVEAVHAVDVDAGAIAFSVARGEPIEAIPDMLESVRDRPWTPDIRTDFQRRRAEVERTNGDHWPERLASVDRHAAPMLAIADPADASPAVRDVPQRETDLRQTEVQHGPQRAVAEPTRESQREGEQTSAERDVPGQPGREDGRSADVQRSLDLLRAKTEGRAPLPPGAGSADPPGPRGISKKNEQPVRDAGRERDDRRQQERDRGPER
ncbi:zeta toxin [Streptomyces sp. 2321.6]|uniref:zeta toxin family protein n=1 Tax=Streptomyces sp. 2321.6 TaxID=1938840 RepID=UPI000BB0F5C6|nr:zeta toxin family protein [Streptomyces sp. 2321.6]PBC72362.1 zeta toxin [Streptomyces sp. 2321.6]PBC72423.1 zeta toxin [Streptomyces sp. 2321.6]